MTAQARDILIYNKEELYISTEPLRDYLKNAQLPYQLVTQNTACSRGYTAKWFIDNKKLFLIEWQGYILNFQKVGIDYLFPDEEFMFAEWFTGTIRIGIGDLVRYIHGGYASVHEGERFLKFEKGVLVDDYTKWLTQEEIEEIRKVAENLPF